MNHTILAIDPGLHSCGWAMRIGDMPIVPGTIRPKSHATRDRIREVVERLPRQAFDGPWDVLVIEMPQVYQERKRKGRENPNDLIKLALLVGAAMMTVPAMRCLTPLPGQWKGSIPKHIHHRQIRRRVPELPRCSTDAMDAVGLLLYGETTCQTQGATFVG